MPAGRDRWRRTRWQRRRALSAEAGTRCGRVRAGEVSPLSSGRIATARNYGDPDPAGGDGQHKAANFVEKRAATFIWGPEQTPWTFTFSTPKTAPWVYDHAYQVTRAEFDQILLDAARERGADVREEHEVTDIQTDGNPSERHALRRRAGYTRVGL